MISVKISFCYIIQRFQPRESDELSRVSTRYYVVLCMAVDYYCYNLFFFFIVQTLGKVYHTSTEEFCFRSRWVGG